MEVEFTPINQLYVEELIDGEYKKTKAKCRKCLNNEILKVNNKYICTVCSTEYVLDKKE